MKCKNDMAVFALLAVCSFSLEAMNQDAPQLDNENGKPVIEIKELKRKVVELENLLQRILVEKHETEELIRETEEVVEKLNKEKKVYKMFRKLAKATLSSQQYKAINDKVKEEFASNRAE